MTYAQLGKTGREVSRITFGCWEMGGTMWEHNGDDANFKAIQTALDHGVTSFDTAEAYGENGHSEEVLGKALFDSGKRKDCFLATKVAPKHLRAADVRSSITASLKRLCTDYVDLYYIHWPNADIPLEETMGEMVKLKEEGLIRAIGVSNFPLPLLKEALDMGWIDAIQPEYSLLQRNIEADLLPFCAENSISVMSYSSLAKGILTGAYHGGGAAMKPDDFRATRRMFLPEHMAAEQELIDAMRDMADRMGVSLSQLAIAWLLRQRGLTSAIVGTQSEKHLLDNLKAAEVTISDADLATLTDVSAKVLKEID